MRTFQCSCSQRLFFDNTVCLNCNHEVGWCPQCRTLRDLLPAQTAGEYNCVSCNALLVKCENYGTHHVCNRMVLPSSIPQANPPLAPFCDYCKLNRTIPDLTIDENLRKWGRLETAKRRVLYDLDMAGLPYGTLLDGFKPGLAFEFKSGSIAADNPGWRAMDGEEEKVYTGHADGIITINIEEADDVVRETLRVQFGEARRTLLGHFRHELGHYVWDAMILGQREREFVDLFGDHTNPDYATALQNYYANGAPLDWHNTHISAYATMHPWEDFAETFANYLNMVSSIDTAANCGLIHAIDFINFDQVLTTHTIVGIAMNEMNRSMGLFDFLPEVFVEPVKNKMRFVHSLTKFGLSPALKPLPIPPTPSVPIETKSMPSPPAVAKAS